MIAWQPNASLTVLKKRAEILEVIRGFFKKRQVLEVETPLLAKASIPDPYIESIKTSDGYLQTSPEFAMKRLLAFGSGPIFQITKAFRNQEIGQRHQPEFTLLEWYRPGFDHHRLMDEVDELLQLLLSSPKAKRLSYKALFEQYLGVNPHTTSVSQLSAIARDKHLSPRAVSDKDDWLNLLLTHIIEPQLQRVTFVYDYPLSQAALAKIDNNVARRFEVYVKGIELANGFHELGDAKEQTQRFAKDLQKRQQLALEPVAIDHYFLAALRHGLPDCAGVALGVDRLMMLALDYHDITDVMSFSYDRV